MKAQDEGHCGRTPASAPAVAEGIVVPRRCTLEGFSEEVSRAIGVDLADLEPLTTLLVRTQHSLYRIIVRQPRERKILIQGGQYFVEPTEACFDGSSFGGSCLKAAWIAQDMRMEIRCGKRRVVTSPVRSVEILQDTSSHRPA